eukprot:TRINITY_DN13063_c0_g1_i1.p1 TRINITY_DN13063_c0_g1~~TRINITY_DN13063_c0_g1_i1.p1  ORF type:complete len:763 (+),score=101.07 TRINITY_DN13063_c0_g1_i1:2255-4543(+)
MNIFGDGLLPVRKNFNLEHPDVAAMTEAEKEELLARNTISVVGPRPPKPLSLLQQAPFPEHVFHVFQLLGYTKPSPIQMQGWPIALSGRDLVGVAETGSGKTLCYVLPGLVHVEAQPSLRFGDGPIALVFAPTRELAMQIDEEFDKYRRKIRSCCVYGGVPKGPQTRELRAGVELVVATPGRLQDHMRDETTNLKRVTYCVLDEADKMLDMGFLPHLASIFKELRSDRQTLMFSATWSAAVQGLAQQFMSEPLVVTVGSSSQSTKSVSVNSNIHQVVEVVDEEAKADNFVDLLRSIAVPGSRVLVFAMTRRKVDQLVEALSLAGVRAAALHGEKPQAERDRIVSDFRQAVVTTVVATDLVARGLDIRNVDCVVNFELPSSIEQYIHRIGRTGRAGAFGRAVSFFSPGIDDTIACELVRVLESAGQEVAPRLRRVAELVDASSRGRERTDSAAKRQRLETENVSHYSSQLLRRISERTPGPALTSGATQSCVGTPSSVLLLRNVVAPGGADLELRSEIEQACSEFGKVASMALEEVDHWSISEEEAVRIFVQFTSEDAARRAFVRMQGRQFGGRVVCCCFYDPVRYAARQLTPQRSDPAMPRVLLLRNAALAESYCDEIRAEVVSECAAFGQVRESSVHILTPELPPAEQVRIFVRFHEFRHCIRALAGLHGRKYNGRVVFASFFDELMLDRGQVAPMALDPELRLPSRRIEAHCAEPVQQPFPEPVVTRIDASQVKSQLRFTEKEQGQPKPASSLDLLQSYD